MKLRTKYLLSVAAIAIFMFFAFASSGDQSESSELSDTTEIPKEDLIQILDQFAEYDSLTHSYTIYCHIKNTGDKNISHAEITSTFYDEEKHVIGTGLANIKELAVGIEDTVDIHGLGIQDSIGSYELEIDNIVLDTL